jgi:5-amino-6-(5-phosphoribosylamino)uracil reductase
VGVAQRPYVLLSVAMSVDGCLDDASDTRLILSNDADLDRVDEVRAGCDAILVGAGTVRRDNPALLVRSPARRDARAARGQPRSPARVTLTGRGDLDPGARFFTAGGGARLVYVPDGAAERVAARLGSAAAAAMSAGEPGTVEVVAAGDPAGPLGVSLPGVLADLAGRGVQRLMVEGGGTVLTQFLAAGLADELHLAVAPVFVGDPAAPRFGTAASGGFVPPGPAPPAGLVPARLHLAEVRLIGDVVLLRYLPDGP